MVNPPSNLNPSLTNGRGWRARPGRGTPCLKLALLFGMLVVLLLASCGKPKPPPGEMGRVLDNKFQIDNPSKTDATATGIGCGLSLPEAVTNAHRIASFNLRGVTGAARYRVVFETLREIPEDNRICVEVAAKALP